jgi:hypothetical protein
MCEMWCTIQAFPENSPILFPALLLVRRLGAPTCVQIQVLRCLWNALRFAEAEVLLTPMP